jgi:hypothetical protein
VAWGQINGETLNIQYRALNAPVRPAFPAVGR